MTTHRRRPAAPRATHTDVEWDFLAFPTFFGAAGGALLAFILAWIANFAFFYLFLIALFAFTFALSHVLFTGSRQRRERRKRMREEEEEIERRVLARRQAGDEAGTSSRRARRRRRG